MTLLCDRSHVPLYTLPCDCQTTHCSQDVFPYLRDFAHVVSSACYFLLSLTVTVEFILQDLAQMSAPP